MHPQGWNALSRNVTSDEQAEWTCVHDIQELAVPSELEEHEELSSEEANSLEHSLADDPLYELIIILTICTRFKIFLFVFIGKQDFTDEHM